MQSPVRWDQLDKAVYDRIAEMQKRTKLQAITIDQKAMSTELGCSLRTLSRAISKLKNRGAIRITRRRGPSVYSVSSEIPRWPVRIAGGVGTMAEFGQAMIRQMIRQKMIRHLIRHPDSGNRESG